MCDDCVKKVKEEIELNNKNVKDRIARGLPLYTEEGVMGTIGHVHLGYPCEHQKNN